MSYSRIKVAGVDLPIETHYRACSVTSERLSSGRHRLSVSASGQYAPDLSTIDWADAVTVEWIDLETGTDWLSLSVISAGPQVQADLDAIGVTWTLTGVEAPAGSVAVTIDGTDYLAKLERAPVDGVPGRNRVTITGSTPDAPVVTAGSVAIVSTLFSGSIIAQGVTAAQDPETGLIDWSLTGVETEAGSTLITIGGSDYWAKMGVSPIGGVIVRRTNGAGELQRAWGKRAVRISGESVTPPSITPGTVAVSGPVYAGDILCRGLSADVDSATGLYTWTVEGEEP